MCVFCIYQPQHGPRFRLPGGAMHAMYRYSPRSDSWSLITRLGERASCAIASCNNKLFITGGRDNKNQVISTVMCWDVDRGVLTEECALPMGVSHHGSVTLMKSYTHIHRITPAPASQWHRPLWTKMLLQTEWKNVMNFFKNVTLSDIIINSNSEHSLVWEEFSSFETYLSLN